MRIRTAIAVVALLLGMQTTVFSQKHVARVLQTTINSKDLEPSAEMKKQAEQQLTVANYKKWATDVKYINLASKVLEILQAQFVKDKGISVAANEVDSFFDYSTKARDIQKSQAQQALGELNSKVASGKLTAQEKEQAAGIKKQIEQQLSVLSQPAPKPTQKEREYAEKIVRTWKFDQMVYKQYGGPVTANQMGFQPVGAYKKFLEDEEKKKTFEITDGSYKKKFWEILTPGKNANLVPPDKVNFNKPWWVLMVEMAQAGGKK